MLSPKPLSETLDTANIECWERERTATLVETSGYVIHSLQTALHDGLNVTSAEEAIVTAVNRGGDTDTIGAITGAVAGARFGASELPDRWLPAIDETEEVESLANQLMKMLENKI